MLLTRISVAVLLLGAGAARAEPQPADPTAMLCQANGATVTIETAPNGSRHGVCVFPNGSRIDEWAYFRNKHRTH